MAAGAIIENMSGRKLGYILGGATLMLILCGLIGGIVSPAPNSSMQFLASKCVDKSAGKDGKKWYWPRGKGACTKIDHFDAPEAAQQQLTADNIVFAFQMPLPRENKEIDFSRWQQTLMTVLSMDIEYEDGFDHDARVHLLVNARLGYRNKGDAPHDWKEYAHSFVHRNLDCDIDEHLKKEGYYYNCSSIPLFDLASLHHDYYLINLRIPSIYDYDGQEISINDKLGKLVDLWLIAIYQNGGFTKVLVTLKTIFFVAVIAVMAWMYKRLQLLPRSPTLLEKMLLALGFSLTLLNLPMEYLTLSFDMPWINLFNDIKQGVFYVMLMVFWLVFAGEHLINDDDTHGHRNGLFDYWKKLAVVLVGSLSLFLFDICERGVQLQDPFYSVWVTDMGSNVAWGFNLVAFGCACGYCLYLFYLIYKVNSTINAKRNDISAMRAVRRIHYEGLIWRFRFLLWATVICAIITAIGFIIGQVAENQYHWNDFVSLEYNSAFITFVYGLWNLYIMGLIFLYAPSHKRSSNENEMDMANSNGEEIEFAVSSVSREASEMSSLTNYLQHQATD